MLDSARARIAQELPDDAKLLDVGGWASPYPRADWVLDLLPYETRGLYGAESDEPERFSAETWIQRDICDTEPWPFADGFFDFAVISHTLEDIRDPVGVCRELSRVAAAGYVEVPARIEEQTYGFDGPWTGWSHHRWFCERADDGALEFVFKPHLVNAGQHVTLPREVLDGLTPEQRVVSFFWTGELLARERIITEPNELSTWLESFVQAHRPPEARKPLSTRARRWLAWRLDPHGQRF